MITYIEGKLAEKHPTRVVMDVGGIGYEVFIPLSSYDRLPKKDERFKLLIFDYIREDTHALYGFADEEERRMFTMLLATSGIGPKLALSALSGMSVKDLKNAVLTGDVKRLCSITGVGRKMAERIVIDVKDKLDPAEALEAGIGDDGNSMTRDAVLALIALGFKQEEARKMIAGVRESADAASVEALIKLALNK